MKLLLHPFVLLLLLGLLGSLGLPGCGASVDQARLVGTPFTAVEEALFDSGVEFVDDPSHLSGRWREEWERDLAGRVERADLIYIGGVESSREGQDGSGRPFLDLTTAVDNVLKGKQGRYLDLRARDRDAGFMGLARSGERLYESPFIVFVKWSDEGDGRVRARFHLAYASGFVVSAVKDQLSGS